jgi:hypothetical protein
LDQSSGAPSAHWNHVSGNSWFADYTSSPPQPKSSRPDDEDDEGAGGAGDYRKLKTADSINEDKPKRTRAIWGDNYEEEDGRS